MFLSTTKDEKHSHIAYIADDGMGVTSVANNHTHNIVQGMVIYADGHDHQLTTASLSGTSKKKKAESDEDVVSEVLELYKEAISIDEESVEQADLSEGFFNGDGQWDDTQIPDGDRAALVMNQIASKIDLLRGYQRRNRQDTKFYPVGEEDGAVADMLTSLLKIIYAQNHFEHEETLIFDDQIIPGRGNVNVDIDFDKDVDGEIVVERYPWRHVRYGPHEKDDLSDCEYLAKFKWYSKAKVKQLWPDKAGEVDATFDAATTGLMTGKKPNVGYPGDNYEQGAKPSPAGINNSAADMVDIAKKNIMVVELWRKEYKTVSVAVSFDTDVYESLEDYDAKTVAAIKTIPGINVVKRNTQRVRVTSIASNILLDDDYPDLPVPEFFIVPVYAYRRDGKWWGKVKCAIDPQRELNKRTSQIVDILNRVAPYGWFYESDTFADDGEKRKFKETSSTPGFTAEVSNLERRPVLQEGIRFPSELANFAQQADDQLSRIMNVSHDMLGQESNATSGAALAQRQRQGLVGNEFLFDNLALAKRRVAKLIVALIQKHYKPERIYRILSNAAAREPMEVQVNGEPQDFNQMPPDVVIQMLANADLTKYDVVVSESSYNPSTRQANFLLWLDASSKGVPVPPGVLVDMSDLPDKARVKAEIQKMQDDAKAVQQDKNNTEIQKTIIAKSGNNADGGYVQ